MRRLAGQDGAGRPDTAEVRPVQPVAGSAAGGAPDAGVSPAESSSPLAFLTDLSSIRAMLRRRTRLMLLTALVVGGGLGGLLAIQTPLYESTALLLIKVGRELVYQPEIGEGKSFTQGNIQAVLNSEVAILLSLPVMEGVVRKVGLEQLYPDLAQRLTEVGSAPSELAERTETALYLEAAQRLSSSLTAQALPEAQVLRIAYRHPDPQVAAQTVGAVVVGFTEEHLEAFGEPELVQFLETRVDDYRSLLIEREKELGEFETRHSALSFDDPHETLLARSDEIRSRLSELDREVMNLRRSELQETSAVAAARTELLALELKEPQLNGRLLDDVRREIRVIKRFIRQREAEVQAQIVSIESGRAALEAELAQADEELAALPELSSQYRALRRERDADAEQYETYSRRLRDARLSHEMDTEQLASINVIQPPFAAPEPIWPRGHGFLIAVIGVLALVVSLLVATFVEALRIPLPTWLDPSSSPDPNA